MKNFAILAALAISATIFGNVEAASTNPLYSRSERDAYYEQRRQERDAYYEQRRRDRDAYYEQRRRNRY